VLGEERLPGLEVESEGGRARFRDVRHDERPREPLLERRPLRARRRGKGEREEYENR